MMTITQINHQVYGGDPPILMLLESGPDDLYGMGAGYLQQRGTVVGHVYTHGGEYEIGFYPSITGSASAFGSLIAFESFLIKQTSDSDTDEISLLETAAEAGDERIFVEVLRQVDWRIRPAEDLVHGVRLALKAGAHLSARQLSRDGLRRHPENPELQKMVRILAPDKVKSTPRPPDSSVRANRNWFANYSAEYRGQWVAIKDGHLLGAASTLQALKTKVPDWQAATVTRIVW